MTKALLTILLAGCLADPTASTAADVRLATTSTVSASGLLDRLLPAYRTVTGEGIRVSITGSGAALREGHEGRADLLLVHSPADEVEFIDDGHGLTRIPLMHNDFLIVGPATGWNRRCGRAPASTPTISPGIRRWV